MAFHSSTLAWKIPWTEEPGGLQSMGLLRIWHDWATSLSLFTFMHWRRKWQPTPVFLPGESQGQGSLVGCCLLGHTESDTTDAICQEQQQTIDSLQKKKKEKKKSYSRHIIIKLPKLKQKKRRLQSTKECLLSYQCISQQKFYKPEESGMIY